MSIPEHGYDLHYQREQDGRPCTDDHHDHDPLLEALMCEHPERAPKPAEQS